MALVVVTQPTIEPVSIDTVKEELRLEISDDDDYIARKIETARVLTETYLRRALITQTLRYTVDGWPQGNYLRGFPQTFYLPRPKLQSVSSVTYTDGEGTVQTVPASDYIVDTDNEPGRVCTAFDKVWPFNRHQINSVKVTYVAGYGDNEADVPAGIREIICLMAAYFYEQRTLITEIPEAYKILLSPYRVPGPWIS